MQNIAPADLMLRPIDFWMNQWLLLTAGNEFDFNMMTVSWGMIGCLWNKPVVQIFVRPQRYTYGFMEKYDSFTLCSFPEEYRQALNILGSSSGRDGDKLAKTNLTLRKSELVQAPSYEEASLILECRKIYNQQMNAQGFLDPTIESHYPIHDYHRIYFGEILTVSSAS